MVMTIGQALKSASGKVISNALENGNELVSRCDLLFTVWNLIGSPEPAMSVELQDLNPEDPFYLAIVYAIQEGWTRHWIKGNSVAAGKPVLRKKFAWIIDKALNPFWNLPVSVLPGNYKKSK